LINQTSPNKNLTFSLSGFLKDKYIVFQMNRVDALRAANLTRVAFLTQAIHSTAFQFCETGSLWKSASLASCQAVTNPPHLRRPSLPSHGCPFFPNTLSSIPRQYPMEKSGAMLTGFHFVDRTHITKDEVLTRPTLRPFVLLLIQDPNC
jgi:hypothetical protein